MLRWIVFRDAAGPDAGETEDGTTGAAAASHPSAGFATAQATGPTAAATAEAAQEPEPTEPVFGPAARPN
jgi:hypothetical protein